MYRSKSRITLGRAWITRTARQILTRLFVAVLNCDSLNLHSIVARLVIHFLLFLNSFSQFFFIFKKNTECSHRFRIYEPRSSQDLWFSIQEFWSLVNTCRISTSLCILFLMFAFLTKKMIDSKHTTLPEAEDRLLSTSINCRYEYIDGSS